MHSSRLYIISFLALVFTSSLWTQPIIEVILAKRTTYT